MLSVVPAGPEFRASTTSTFYENTRHGMSAVGMDAGGNFVVVWGYTAMGQRFNSAGEPQGGPFALSSDTFRPGDTPSVGVSANGSFVATFHRYDVDFDRRTTVWARRFGADGVARGPDERISTSTTGRGSFAPSVAVEADGDYVVAWTEQGPTQEESDVYARRFNADGVPRGEPFRVNTYLTSVQNAPSVAVNDAGAFVVAWSSWEQDGSMEGVFAQRYDADGKAVGGEFQVNQEEGSQQMEPSVAMDASGKFAVAWQSSDGGALLRRFGADGTPLHNERDADGPFHGDDPFIVSDAAGGLVMSFEDIVTEADYVDTFVRRFGPDGTPLGDPVRANSTVPGTQGYPSLAMRTTEDFVVVWSDGEVGYPDNPNATPDGVYARRFVPAPPPARVAGRHVFYNGSAYDGRSAGADAADDGAVATDKAALLPGQAPSFDNITSYARGINGVMVDVAGLPAGAGPTPDDFDVAGGPAPTSVTVRRGAGVGGSDRVTLAWAGAAARNAWLRVTVKAGARTGLASPDVFSFGNLVGETGDAGSPRRVGAVDVGSTRARTGALSNLSGRYDFNRDGRVNSIDLAAVREALNRTLALPPATPTVAGAVTVPPSRAAVDRPRRLTAEVLT